MGAASYQRSCHTPSVPEEPRHTSLVVAAVALVTVLAAARWTGIGLHAGDVVYLLPFEAITMGTEAPRPLRQLSWGLLHSLGHLGLAPERWSLGKVGWPLSLVAVGLVPWTAWVTARVGRALGLEPTEVALGAVLAAMSPAVLLNAGTIDTVARWMAIGLGLLAIAVVMEALRAPSRSFRRALVAAGLLQAIAIAWHPSAVAVPLALAVSVGLSLPRSAWPRGVAAVGLGVASALLWIAGSGQGAIAAVGAGSLADALWYEPLLASLQLGWQLPVVGRLWLAVPEVFVAALVPAIGLALLRSSHTRPLGAAVLGSLLLLLPDGAGVGFLPAPVLAWTVGTTQSAMAASVLASLVGAVALLRVPRHRKLVVVGVLLVTLVRGVLLLDARRVEAGHDSRIQQVLAVQLLIPAATRDDMGPVLVGSPASLMEPLKGSKWLPELPVSRRRPPGPRDLSSRTVGPVQGAPAGIDSALWQSAVHRCELWLGLPRDRDGPCGQHVEVRSERPGGWGCSLDVRGESWHPRCPPRPPALTAAQTRDRRALPWALVALISLGVSLGLEVYCGSRRSKT
jgi:hypothetical protein